MQHWGRTSAELGHHLCLTDTIFYFILKLRAIPYILETTAKKIVEVFLGDLSINAVSRLLLTNQIALLHVAAESWVGIIMSYRMFVRWTLAVSNEFDTLF